MKDNATNIACEQEDIRILQTIYRISCQLIPGRAAAVRLQEKSILTTTHVQQMHTCTCTISVTCRMVYHTYTTVNNYYQV
jgi:hypothetical protein